MRPNTKSSITLPPEELRTVLALQTKLKARSKVEVVRRGLRLLRDVRHHCWTSVGVESRVWPFHLR